MYIISQKNAHIINTESIVSLDIDETNGAAPAAIIARIHPSWSITLGHYNNVEEAREAMRFIAWGLSNTPDDTVKTPTPDEMRSAHKLAAGAVDSRDIESLIKNLFGGEAK